MAQSDFLKTYKAQKAQKAAPQLHSNARTLLGVHLLLRMRMPRSRSKKKLSRGSLTLLPLKVYPRFLIR